jgi:glucokinase
LRQVLRDRGALTSEDVFNAGRDGDAVGERIVQETAFYLAIGTVNIMHTLDPDVVVFGGGMIAAGTPFLEQIRRHVRLLAFPVPAEKTVIRFAELGLDAGFIGAAGEARKLHLVERRR